MNAGLMVLYHSRVISAARRAKMKRAMQFLGFWTRWFDLADGPPEDHPSDYAAVLALHEDVEAHMDQAFGEALLGAVGNGTGYVSLDHRFPADRPWIDGLTPAGSFTAHSFTFSPDESFILAWKQPGEVVEWPAGLELTRIENHGDYRPLVFAGENPAVICHVRRPHVRFLFDADYWFASAYNDSLGMVDVLWRSIVWAAKKPLPLLCVPPFVTARVDDANGTRNFFYAKRFRRHGMVPNIGLFLDHLPDSGPMVEAMRHIDATGEARFAPHARDPFRLLFFDRDIGPCPDSVLAANFELIEKRFGAWRIGRARTVNPHWGQVGLNCLPLFRRYDYPYVMLQFAVGEAIGSAPMRDWSPRPFGNYAFVADHTPGLPGIFSLISHWHPSDNLEWIGPEQYRIRLDAYMRTMDFLFGRTVFDPERYYATVETYPHEESLWRREGQTNDLAGAAHAAAESIRLALQASFYGCITTHEYSLAVLAEQELEEIFRNVDCRLNRYERIPADYDDVATYLHAHAQSEWVDCQADGKRLTLRLRQSAMHHPVLLQVTVFDGPYSCIRQKRVAFQPDDLSPSLQRWAGEASI